MKRTSLKNNLILSTFYQILTLVIPLITTPYAARVLGVEGTGIYSYTHSYVMYFMLFGALGMVAYGTREIAQHRDNKQARSQIFWEIAILTFITTSFAILAWGIWILFNHTYRVYYIILTIYLFGTMFDISWFFAGMEEFKYTVSQNCILKFLGAALIFVFVKEKDDLWIYILILAITTFFANISMWIYLPKFVNRISIKSIKLKHHFQETVVYFIPTVAISIYTILDKTLIGLITKDTRENGNYEQATKIVNMAKSVSFAGVNLVFQSRISYLFAQGKNKEIKNHISTSMDYIMFIGCAVCFGLIGVSERFVPFFFGPDYEKTIVLLRLMSPLVVIVGISNCLGSQFYTPAGLRARSAKYIIIGSVVNLILNLVLIPFFKSEGAVISSIIAETVISVLYLLSCDDYYRTSVLLRQSWKKLIAGIVMMTLVQIIGRIIDNALVTVITQIIIGCFVYFVVLIVVKDSFVWNVIVPYGKKTLDRLRRLK